MDKLQWFKFTPSDWMMGKIQRCPEITQARFIRLCCLYWNKNCEISIEDAEIEIDKEHYDILVKRKIISTSCKNINISFLDEQNLEIKEISKDKKINGIVGNLKRWHFPIYQMFTSKEISLEEAIELSKTIVKQSHTDSTPIEYQSQNIADKIREDKDKRREEEDKIREDKINISVPEISIDSNPKEIKEKIPYQEIVDIFHSVCVDLPKLKTLTEKRKKSISKIIKEYSFENLGDVFKKVNESDFLSGRKSDFKSSFDWIMNPNNFVKILEDNYKNNSNGREKSSEQVFRDAIGSEVAQYDYFK